MNRGVQSDILPHALIQKAMAKIVTVVNQKGGVGKTTTAVNLGAYLAHHGKFVLLVDMDAQANASSGIGVGQQAVRASVYDALMNAIPANDLIVSSTIQGLSVLPATIDLAGAAVDLVNLERREFRLFDALLAVKNNFNIFIFIIITTLSRSVRFFVASLIASFLGRRYKSFISKHSIIIVIVYVILFFLTLYLMEAMF